MQSDTQGSSTYIRKLFLFNQGVGLTVGSSGKVKGCRQSVGQSINRLPTIKELHELLY